MEGGRAPLFKGATRLPTFFLVPRPVAIAVMVVSSVSFLWIHLYSLLLASILWFVCFVITKNDDRAFHMLYLFFRTKFRGISSNHHKTWNGSSSSPADYRWKK